MSIRLRATPRDGRRSLRYGRQSPSTGPTHTTFVITRRHKSPRDLQFFHAIGAPYLPSFGDVGTKLPHTHQALAALFPEPLEFYVNACIYRKLVDGRATTNYTTRERKTVLEHAAKLLVLSDLSAQLLRRPGKQPQPYFSRHSFDLEPLSLITVRITNHYPLPTNLTPRCDSSHRPLANARNTHYLAFCISPLVYSSAWTTSPSLSCRGAKRRDTPSQNHNISGTAAIPICHAERSEVPALAYPVPLRI